jgi:hypothetical protein
MDDSDDFDMTRQNRRTGRPRNADRPVIPWEEIARLLAFGETVRDEEPVCPLRQLRAVRKGVKRPRAHVGFWTLAACLSPRSPNV